MATIPVSDFSAPLLGQSQSVSNSSSSKFSPVTRKTSFSGAQKIKTSRTTSYPHLYANNSSYLSSVYSANDCFMTEPSSKIIGLGLRRADSTSSHFSVFTSDASSSENEASEEEDDKSVKNPFSDDNMIKTISKSELMGDDTLCNIKYNSSTSSSEDTQNHTKHDTNHLSKKLNSQHVAKSRKQSISSEVSTSSTACSRNPSVSRSISGISFSPNTTVSVPQDSIEFQDVLTPTDFSMPLRSNVVSTCASIDSEGTLTLTGKPSGLVSRSSSLFKTTLANNSSTSLDKSCGSPNSNDSHQSEVPELKLFNKKVRQRSKPFSSRNDSFHKSHKSSNSLYSLDNGHVGSSTPIVTSLNDNYGLKSFFKLSDQELRNYEPRTPTPTKISFEINDLSHNDSLASKNFTSRDTEPAVSMIDQQQKKQSFSNGKGLTEIDTKQANKIYQQSKKNIQATQSPYSNATKVPSNSFSNITKTKTHSIDLRKSKSQGVLRTSRSEIPAYQFTSLLPIVQSNGSQSLKVTQLTHSNHAMFDPHSEPKKPNTKPKMNKFHKFSASSGFISLSKPKISGAGHHSTSLSVSNIDKLQNKSSQFETKTGEKHHRNQTSTVSLPSSPNGNYAQKYMEGNPYQLSEPITVSIPQANQDLATQLGVARLASQQRTDPLGCTPNAGRSCIEASSMLVGINTSCQFINVLSK